MGACSPILMVVHYVWKRLCTWKRFYHWLLFLLHSFSVSKRLPLVCYSLIYLVAFPSFLLPSTTLYHSVFFIFLSCLYSVYMRLNLSLEKLAQLLLSWMPSCLGHFHAFISVLVFLPVLISLPLSFAVICRLLAFVRNQMFHLQELHMGWHKEHISITDHNTDMSKVAVP